jgi:hypothetical protein
LAALAGLSVTHFAHAFKATYQVPENDAVELPIDGHPRSGRVMDTMAEVAIPRQLFAAIMQRIAELRLLRRF